MSEEKPAEVIPDIFDRRGDNRAASQWVRKALNEQTEKIDKLSGQVNQLYQTFVKAVPDGDPTRHHESHLLIEQREAERKANEEHEAKRREENRKFWEGIKQDIYKNALKAVGLFLIGVLVMGTQAKFKEWVLWAVGGNTAQVEVKK